MKNFVIRKSTLFYSLILFCFCSIFLWLFVTYPFGDDILQYLYHVRQMQKISYIEDFLSYTNGYDVLFFVILKIFSFLDDEHLYLLCFALYFLICLVFIGKMYLQSIYRILLFIILVLFSRLYMDFLFNAIRTEFAALSFLVSFYFILKLRYSYAFFFLILGGLFHFQMMLFFLAILGLSKVYSFFMCTRLNYFLLFVSLLGILSKDAASYIFSFIYNILSLLYSKTIYYSNVDITSVSLTLILLFLVYLFSPTLLLITQIKNKFLLSFIVIANIVFFSLYGAFPFVLRIVAVLYPLLIVGLVLNQQNNRIRYYMGFLVFLSICTIIYIPFKGINYTLEPSPEVLMKLEGML